MQLDEKKFNKLDYKAYYQEEEVEGTQSVKTRMQIKDSEFTQMLDDNAYINRYRLCFKNSMDGIVPIWWAYGCEKEFMEALSSEKNLIEVVKLQKIVASGSQSAGSVPEKELKKHCHIWLLLCLLHCVNTRIGTLYYLHSGKPIREDLERDKKRIQDASYFVLHGDDFVTDLKNAISNAQYFAREMCDQTFKIYNHSLTFFFDPDDKEESRYNYNNSTLIWKTSCDTPQNTSSKTVLMCNQSCTPINEIQKILLEMRHLGLPVYEHD